MKWPWRLTLIKDGPVMVHYLVLSQFPVLAGTAFPFQKTLNNWKSFQVGLQNSFSVILYFMC